MGCFPLRRRPRATPGGLRFAARPPKLYVRVMNPRLEDRDRARPLPRALALLFPLSLLLLQGVARAGEPFSASEPALTVSPLAVESIQRIVSLGNLNPRGWHVFPTDHMYLDYGGAAGLQVLAPADGTVFAVRTQSKGDFKVEIRLDAHVCIYVAHLFVEPGIEAGRAVKAGQVLGRTSGRSWLDLGAYDSRVRLAGFANPSRYPQSTLQTVSPLRLFVEPLRGRLYGKVRREGADKDGRCDQDVPGRLAGNWFLESAGMAPKKDSSDPFGSQGQLAFVHDVEHPTQVRISIGGTIAPPGIYATTPEAPDPAVVSVESGLVRYPLVQVDSGSSGRDEPARSLFLLVRVMDPTRLRVTCVATNATNVGALDLDDDHAWTYRR